jgi:regulator of sigma E protease
MGFSEPDYSSTTIGDLVENYPAAAAGIQKGDKILTVNHEPAGDWKNMQSIITKGTGDISLEVNRNNRVLTFTIPLKSSEVSDYYGRKTTRRIVGVVPSIKFSKYNVFTGFLKGIEALFTISFFMLKGFALMIIGALPFKEAISGPIGIYHITAQAREAGVVAIFHLMAILNVSLAVINLMPLPLMDGGHAFLFMLEKIRKRQLSEKTEDVISRIGFALIITLMVFVFYNDLVKFGPKMWHGSKEALEKRV